MMFTTSKPPLYYTLSGWRATTSCVVFKNPHNSDTLDRCMITNLPEPTISLLLSACMLWILQTPLVVELHSQHCDAMYIRLAVWYERSSSRSMRTLQELNMATCLQIPEEEQESYTKGQHLRGADAKNADRVRAEIVRLLRPVPSVDAQKICINAFWHGLRPKGHLHV